MTNPVHDAPSGFEPTGNMTPECILSLSRLHAATTGLRLSRERSELAEAILGHSKDAAPATLVNLCSLGEAVGVENAKLAEWRSRAVEIRRELLAKYREKYSEYRLRSTVSPGAPETLAILDDMIAIGLEENQFHKWALRERERVAGRKEGVAK